MSNHYDILIIFIYNPVVDMWSPQGYVQTTNCIRMMFIEPFHSNIVNVLLTMIPMTNHLTKIGRHSTLIVHCLYFNKMSSN